MIILFIMLCHYHLKYISYLKGNQTFIDLKYPGTEKKYKQMHHRVKNGQTIELLYAGALSGSCPLYYMT